MDKLLLSFPKQAYLYGNVVELNQLENKRNYYEVIIDVVNKKMLEYDLKLLRNEDIDYEPYFYFLTFTTSDEGIIKYIKENNNSILKIFVNDVLESSNNLTSLVFISRMNKISKKYSFEIIDEKNDLDEYQSLSNELFNQIVTVNDKNKEELLSDVFTFNKINKINFSIYHVGLGHASYFTFNDKDKGFFDIGFTRHIALDKTVSYRSINTHKPKWIILSHWDIEHYCGVVNYYVNNIFSIPWVAPIEYKKHFAFFRILGLLNKYQGKLYLIDKSFTGYNYLKYFYLYKGIGKKANDSGLFIALSNNYKMFSLGDLDYKYLPKGLPFYDIDYLIIPHHGSLQSGICPFKTRDFEALAIIPVGFNNYEYPNNIMLNILRNRGFKIHNTYVEKSYFGSL